jgi:nitroimidazol reductase NimA-like FMN-containing flavoprotein (pyridoxamine 5'-phosphate oxidase superfamily)
MTLMTVHELSRADCDAVLSRATIVRLGCVNDGQPYVVPLHVAFDGYHLYGLSTVGRKIEWMRANPRVCVEVEEIQGPSQWTTVLVFGHYEELGPADAAAREWAEALLAPRATFWAPAMARPQDRVTPVVFRVRITRVTGRSLRRGE